MPKGYIYILKCFDDTYYTGSTIDLEKRIEQHQNGLGANYTKKRLPIKLIYLEEYDRIDLAFNREKQIQGWSRKKKEALILKNTVTYQSYLKTTHNLVSLNNSKNGGFDKLSHRGTRIIM